MAQIELNDAVHEGKVALPRVLVVDVPGIMMNTMKQGAEVIRREFQVEPVFMTYDPSHTAASLKAIAEYALHPENKIEMLLTGNKHDHFEYGPELAGYLKNAHPQAFKGPIAIQVNSPPSHLEKAAAVQLGAIGMYEKANGLQKDGAFAALVHAYQQGRAI